MKYTRYKAANGICVQLQEIKTEEGSFSLAIRVEMPDNDKGGVKLIDDKYVSRYVNNIRRVPGYTSDHSRFRNWNDTYSEPYINYAINGCTGVWFDGNGRITQKKINAAVARVTRICGAMKLR